MDSYRRWRPLLLALGLLGPGLLASGEDPVEALGESWPWRVFDRQEGLRSATVSALHQDRFEYIYAGSDQGVCRYDLWEWTELSSAQPFDDGEVREFAEAFGNLYAVTANSLWRVEGGTSLNRLVRGAGIHAASSPQGELFLIDEGTRRHIQIRGESTERVDPEVQLPPGRVLDYQIDTNRTHWLATNEGLFARSMARRAWLTLSERELDSGLHGKRCLRFFRVQGPAERVGYPDARGWVSQWEELWALFREPRGSGNVNVLAALRAGQWETVAQIEGPPIQGLICDASHDYYATDEDGRVFFYSEDDNRSGWRLVEDLGTGKVALYAEILDASGVLWFRVGTGGVAAFDPQSRRWEAIPTGSEQRYPNVLSLIETEEGEVWMGMTRGLSRHRRGASAESYESALGVPLVKITGLAEDEQRNIWISSESFPGALCFIESIWTRQTTPGFSDYPIRRIVRDRLKEVWFLSEDRTPSGESVIYHFSHYTLNKIVPVRVPHGPVNDLIRAGGAIGAGDVFWLATDEGLLRGTVEDDRFSLGRRYTEENGLRSRRVFAAAEGPDGAIWVCYPGASAGVTRIQGGEASHFDVEDGLASPEVWSIAANGRNLWFGTDRGLSRYDGECWYNYPIASRDPRISRVLPVFPSVTESDSVLVGTWGLGALRFRLDDRRRPRRPRFTRSHLPRQVGPEGNVLFSWDARDFRNDTPPDGLLFRSRLDRGGWSGFTSTRFRDVRGLVPGPHVLEVEVRDLDGNRNREELLHSFEVLEPRKTHLPWILVSAAAIALAGIAWFGGPRIVAAARRRRLHRHFFRDCPFPFFLLGPKGTVLEVGGVSGELVGMELSRPLEVIGKPVQSLPIFADRESRAGIKRLLEGERLWIKEHRWSPDGGEERVLEIRGFPLAEGGSRARDGERTDAGEDSAEREAPPGLAVIVMEDKTGRVEEERLLDRTRRLTSLRNFAARVAANTGELLESSPLPEIEQAHPKLSERLRRLEAVARRLSAFAGKLGDSAEWRPVVLNELLEQLVGASSEAPAGRERLRVEGGVRVDYRGQPGLWSVLGDESRLSEALLAVLQNGVESMQEKGTLTVRTANLRLHDDPGLLPPGPYVEVTVRDTGPGMDPGQVERVFEPFYSTKPRDEALGIGLSAAYGIVRSHGGDVRLESRPGRGTTVRWLLPANRGP